MIHEKVSDELALAKKNLARASVGSEPFVRIAVLNFIEATGKLNEIVNDARKTFLSAGEIATFLEAECSSLAMDDETDRLLLAAKLSNHLARL